MLRSLVVTLCLIALAAPAMAVVDIQGAGPITVLLNIDPYTQVWFQDDTWSTPPAAGEPDIVFSGTQGVDYYRPGASGLIGQYLVTNGTSGTAQDGWACGYFESFDGATVFIKSNTDFSGSIATSGDLDDGLGNTIPTWFTIAVTGWDDCAQQHDPNGFRLGNSGSGMGWVADGPPPGSSTPGGYAGNGNTTGEDVAGPVTFSFGNQAFYPNQDAFQMIGNNGSAFDLDAPVGPGTMKFLARCRRDGVHDVSGNYTATLTPTFVVP